MPSALIVDDDDDMRALVRATIEAANQGLTVAGEAADGLEAMARWKSDRPSVVVLDNRMPGMTGLEVARQILAEHPEQSIILFTAYDDTETFAEARRLGVRACLTKSEFHRIPDALWLHSKQPD